VGACGVASARAAARWAVWPQLFRRVRRRAPASNRPPHCQAGQKVPSTCAFTQCGHVVVQLTAVGCCPATFRAGESSSSAPVPNSVRNGQRHCQRGSPQAWIVKGHCDLPGGGRESCPVTVAGELPGGGHGICLGDSDFVGGGEDVVDVVVGLAGRWPSGSVLLSWFRLECRCGSRGSVSIPALASPIQPRDAHGPT